MLACPPRRQNGLPDAASGNRRVFVRRAAQPFLKFHFARSGENDMRVRVNKTGHDDLVRGVNHYVGLRRNGQVFRRADPRNSVFFDNHRAVFDDAERIYGGTGDGVGLRNSD